MTPELRYHLRLPEVRPGAANLETYDNQKKIQPLSTSPAGSWHGISYGVRVFNISFTSRQVDSINLFNGPLIVTSPICIPNA